MTSRNHGFTEVWIKGHPNIEIRLNNIINYSCWTMKVAFIWQHTYIYTYKYNRLLASTYLLHQFWSCLTKNTSEYMLHQVKSKVSVMLEKING